MPRVYSKPLDKSIDVQRIIGHVSGDTSGPCLIFLAGVHGNEPSGIFALRQVFEELDKFNHIKGSVYGISGNLWALEREERFHTTDLNRLWTRKHINELESGTFEPENEDEKEQLSIHKTIDGILQEESGPFYFFDLHTTSGKTIPFITVNDSLLNRMFTGMYPLPSILGIEEYLDGPILSYINELGYVSFGFEGGQHDALEAIENHRIFILLSLLFAGVIKKNQIPFKQYLDHWKILNPDHQVFYEIYHRYEIQPDEEFYMQPGFSNFQKISKGVVLAKSNGRIISAKAPTTLFMPLYQSKGRDGFFLVKRTPRFFLWLSGILRRYRVDKIFPVLPGVKWSSKLKDSMVVDLKIARFIARPLFHLFGYRSKQVGETHLHIRNREYRSRQKDYINENWYKTLSNKS